ncbi:rnhA [Symbiodinium natans]|uniref:RnhA protein n=1 Tax=Symbiodinium natans TaxID=878477 RepID=A0A812U293_9DINO|nr:rnhA [Symbiodinium natans]
MLAHKILVAWLLILQTAESQQSLWRTPELLEKLPAQGECQGGGLPAGCSTGRLRGFDWRTYLGLLCSELPRSLARQAILQALAHFDAENARACPEGFAVTILALYGAGASEFEDQVIRFKPDGSSHFLILAWNLQKGKAVLDHWSTSLPAHVPLSPPWPLWTFPGPLKFLQQAQDLSQLKELAPSLRCNELALASIECESEAPLLQALCAHCETNLPCTYSEDLLQHLSRVVQAADGLKRKAKRPRCGHAVLAALLALNGRGSAAAPRTDSELYRVRSDQETLVMHSTFKRVAQDPDRMFAFNVPLMDLSPFPFHTSMLRSARAERPSTLYQDAVKAVSQSLQRHGIWHAVVPGDASLLAPAPAGVVSIFLPALSMLQLSPEDWMVADLNRELLGHWRLVHVSRGLWQIGEEPYRFSPRSGVAYRAFCADCVYVSLYFYVQEETTRSILPLAPWVPCKLAMPRLFPVRYKDGVPMAADMGWLRRASSVAATGASCAEERARLTKHLSQVEQLDEDMWADDPEYLTHAASPAFNLADGIHLDLGLYDLMRQREDSESAGLRRFSDKVLFKSWMMQESIPIAKIHYMSNESPEVLAVLQSLPSQSFVAKPTHLAATSYVYVIKDGRNLVNGLSVSHEEIASGLKEAWNDRHLDDWATESTRPGVLVEELVETSGKQGTPDELKCQTFWGKLFFCEWTFVQNMSSGEEGAARFNDANQQGDRAQPALGHQACGIPNFASNGYIFRDGSCLDCVARPPLTGKAWKQLVLTVEKIARGSDHIRIDVFVPGGNNHSIAEASLSAPRKHHTSPALSMPTMDRSNKVAAWLLDLLPQESKKTWNSAKHVFNFPTTWTGDQFLVNEANISCLECTMS